MVWPREGQGVDVIQTPWYGQGREVQGVDVFVDFLMYLSVTGSGAVLCLTVSKVLVSDWAHVR